MMCSRSTRVDLVRRHEDHAFRKLIRARCGRDSAVPAGTPPGRSLLVQALHVPQHQVGPVGGGEPGQYVVDVRGELRITALGYVGRLGGGGPVPPAGRSVPRTSSAKVPIMFRANGCVSSRLANIDAYSSTPRRRPPWPRLGAPPREESEYARWQLFSGPVPNPRSAVADSLGYHDFLHSTRLCNETTGTAESDTGAEQRSSDQDCLSTTQSHVPLSGEGKTPRAPSPMPTRRRRGGTERERVGEWGSELCNRASVIGGAEADGLGGSEVRRW